MKNKTDKVAEYNADNYTRYSLRVRNGTQLAKKIEENTDDGEYSLNFLVTKLLCEHFEIELPHKYYEHRTIIYDTKNQDDINHP